MSIVGCYSSFAFLDNKETDHKLIVRIFATKGCRDELLRDANEPYSCALSLSGVMELSMSFHMKRRVKHGEAISTT